jgi:hypothetical protein
VDEKAAPRHERLLRRRPVPGMASPSSGRARGARGEFGAVNDNHDHDLDHRRRMGMLFAGPLLSALAGLLAYQIIGEPLPALGAVLGAGLIVFTLWGRLVVRPDGVSYGRAVGIGLAATFAAFFGAAVLGAATSRVAADQAAFSAGMFAIVVVLPVMVAAAVAAAAASAVRGHH